MSRCSTTGVDEKDPKIMNEWRKLNPKANTKTIFSLYIFNSPLPNLLNQTLDGTPSLL